MTRAPHDPAPRRLAAAALLALPLLAAGCVSSSPALDGVPVTILDGHRHSDYCGHYYYSFQWYFVKDHHHGEGCGHVFKYGEWTIE